MSQIESQKGIATPNDVEDKDENGKTWIERFDNYLQKRGGISKVVEKRVDDAEKALEKSPRR